MNKLLLVFLFAATSLTTSAQKVYFVYLQSEPEQPFFVKMDDKIYSSSASGYLILAKLRDTSYSFKVGFPQNKWPEQVFTVAVNRKDHGFLLKEFGDKGWGLFDLQTLAVQMSATGIAKVADKVKTDNKDVSAFTEILSKASDDPSLKEKQVQQKPEEKPAPKTESVAVEVIKKQETKKEIREPAVIKTADVVTIKAEKKEDPKTAIKEPAITKSAEIIDSREVNKEEGKVVIEEVPVSKPVEPVVELAIKKEDPKIVSEQPVLVSETPKESLEEEYTRSVVTKRSESSTTEGFGLVFIDNYENGTRDTIRLLIPNPRLIVGVEMAEPKEEKKFLDIVTEAPKKQEEKPVEPQPKMEEKPVAAETPVEKPVALVNCPATADENDFFKLRKAMAAAEGDEEMVAEAKKYFKIKCFTTAQLKNLSTLFLNDEGKYNFFDAAYKHVSDKASFVTLQSELKDEYFINRFKAIIR